MFDVLNGISGQAVNVLVIPDLSVKFHEAVLAHFAIDEEILVLVFL